MKAGDPFLLDRELQHGFQCREFILELALINFALELSKSLVDFVIGLEFRCVNSRRLKDILIINEAVALNRIGHTVNLAILRHIVEQALDHMFRPAFAA